jgi:4-amino-4-deoxy-L-arabinose transferase-like glycosyltransferase
MSVPHPRAGSRRIEVTLDWIDRNARGLAVVAVLFSLVVAAGSAMALGDQIRYYDEQEYVGLADSVAAGSGLSVGNGVATAYRPPGYPFLLAPISLVTGGSVLAMRLVGVLCLVVSVWLVYRLGRRLGMPAIGAVAALATAGYPLLLYTATTLYPQVAALMLLLLSLDCAIAAVGPEQHRQQNRVLLALTAGLALGGLTLTVATFVPGAVVTIAGLLWRRCRLLGFRRLVPVLAAICIGAVAIPSVWIARNAVEFGAFIPVSTNTGLNLLLGNSENATAGSGRATDITRYTNAADAAHLGEVAADRFFARGAVDWVEQHPADAAVLYVEKVANTFAYRNDLATAGQHSALQDVVSAVTFYPILGLAVLRLALVRRRSLHSVEWMLILLVVSTVLVQAGFFTRIRFRVPLDPLMILLAISGLRAFIGIWTEPARRGEPV